MIVFLSVLNNMFLLDYIGDSMGRERFIIKINVRLYPPVFSTAGARSPVA